MNVLWVKIRSSHALRTIEDRRTYCGRVASSLAEVSDTLPAGRSCESCARILIRLQERQGQM